VSNLRGRSAHYMWPTRPPVRNMLWDVGCVGMHTPFRKKHEKIHTHMMINAIHADVKIENTYMLTISK